MVTPTNQRALLPLSFRLPLLSPPTSLEFNRRRVAVVGTISLLRATIDASQPASEAEVRALAATLKKGKSPAAGASARTATAGGGASGAGASGAGARGTAPPIDDDLSNKNIEVCFSITYKERGKKEITENFWCPGTIESVSDESTVLGRKKLGCGWVFVNYRDGEADWQLLRPNFFNAKKPGGWRIVASAAELETNFTFEDLSEGDESGDESDDESDDGNGDDEGGSSDDDDE